MNLGSVSSGMDINSMVNKIVDSERVPKQARIDNARAQIGVDISAYGRLRESLDTMKNLMTSFRQEKAFATRSVESSNSDVVSATATTDAIAGRYAIDVLQLAQSHKVASEALPDDTRFGAGKLQLSLGEQTFSVDISNRARLMDVVRGINASDNNPGIRASVINDSDGQRLIVASDRSGADNQISITVKSEVDNPLKTFEYQSSEARQKTLQEAKEAADKALVAPAAGQEVAAFDPERQIKIDETQAALRDAQQSVKNYSGMTEVQAGQDAVVMLDGVARLSSENNVIENAVDGIDIMVKGVTDPSEKVTEIGVEYDRQSVKNHIEQFVNAYNQFYQLSKELAAVDPQTGAAGPLAGDSVVRSAQTRLGAIFSAPIEQAPEELQTLSEFGVTATRYGVLEINYSMLDRQLNNNFTELGDFFGGNNGFAKKVEDAIQSLTGVTGAIRSRENSLREENYRLNSDQDALDRRMTNLEERTKNRFMAMQDATAKMQGQLSGMMNALG